MPQIQIDKQPVTQITIVESEPDKQAEALSLMTERARFMARQPGFISISLHRSLDGRIVLDGCGSRILRLMETYLPAMNCHRCRRVLECRRCGGSRKKPPRVGRPTGTHVRGRHLPISPYFPYVPLLLSRSRLRVLYSGARL